VVRMKRACAATDVVCGRLLSTACPASSRSFQPPSLSSNLEVIFFCIASLRFFLEFRFVTPICFHLLTFIIIRPKGWEAALRHCHGTQPGDCSASAGHTAPRCWTIVTGCTRRRAVQLRSQEEQLLRSAPALRPCSCLVGRRWRGRGPLWWRAARPAIPTSVDTRDPMVECPSLSLSLFVSVCVSCVSACSSMHSAWCAYGDNSERPGDVLEGLVQHPRRQGRRFAGGDQNRLL
jgi:hypothetical protein